MKELLNDIRTFAPKAKTNTRNKTKHIRVTVSEEQIKIFQDRYPHETHKNSYCSNSYLTHNVSYHDEIIPVVLSHKSFKTSHGSILQKQLTPTKLNICGEYTSIENLVNGVNDGFSKIEIDLETKTMLLNLLDHVLFDTQIVNFELYKTSKRSIDKDYGEILAGAYLLRNNHNVFFPEGEATAFFDLSSQIGKNLIKYNVKSGSGSGQSFKALTITGNDHCSEMMKTIAENGNGYEKIKKYIELSKSEHSPVSKIMNDLKPTSNLTDFTSMLETIWKEHNIPHVGLPKIEEYDEDRAYMFAGCTLIANTYPTDVVTETIDKAKPDIEILHVRSSKDAIYFQNPKEVSYKFHFWGNYNRITNNLPGFKSIY